jgi:hypothetical protein
MTNISPAILKDWLGRNCENASVRLKDIARRAEILRATANEIQTVCAGSVVGLVQGSGGRVAGHAGLYERLEQLSAFRDSDRKKSTAFIATIYFSRRFSFEDIESVKPMVDYHRMSPATSKGPLGVRFRQQ